MQLIHVNKWNLAVKYYPNKKLIAYYNQSDNSILSLILWFFLNNLTKTFNAFTIFNQTWSLQIAHEIFKTQPVDSKAWLIYETWDTVFEMLIQAMALIV